MGLEASRVRAPRMSRRGSWGRSSSMGRHTGVGRVNFCERFAGAWSGTAPRRVLGSLSRMWDEREHFRTILVMFGDTDRTFVRNVRTRRNYYSFGEDWGHSG